MHRRIALIAPLVAATAVGAGGGAGIYAAVTSGGAKTATPRVNVTNVQPVVTAAMAWAFLREPLPAGFALSSALVLGGVWIAQPRQAPEEGPAG